MTSTIDRLQTLPEVFNGTDVMREFNWNTKRTNEMLTRWKQRGWVSTLGKRLDVYSNNLKVKKEDRLQLMLLKWDSNSLDLSHRTWSEHNWTTQFPSRNIVASTKLVRDVKAEEVYLKHRPLRWWKTMFHGIEIKKNKDDLHQLKPEWLLAEALCSQDTTLWCPEADDLDFNEIVDSTTLDEWNSAFESTCKYYKLFYVPLTDANMEEQYTYMRNSLISNYPSDSTPSNHT